jgi:hypothetical protein
VSEGGFAFLHGASPHEIGCSDFAHFNSAEVCSSSSTEVCSSSTVPKSTKADFGDGKERATAPPQMLPGIVRLHRRHWLGTHHRRRSAIGPSLAGDEEMHRVTHKTMGAIVSNLPGRISGCSPLRNPGDAFSS